MRAELLSGPLFGGGAWMLDPSLFILAHHRCTTGALMLPHPSHPHVTDQFPTEPDLAQAEDWPWGSWSELLLQRPLSHMH